MFKIGGDFLVVDFTFSSIFACLPAILLEGLPALFLEGLPALSLEGLPAIFLEGQEIIGLSPIYIYMGSCLSTAGSTRYISYRIHIDRGSVGPS